MKAAGVFGGSAVCSHTHPQHCWLIEEGKRTENHSGCVSSAVRDVSYASFLDETTSNNRGGLITVVFLFGDFGSLQLRSVWSLSEGRSRLKYSFDLCPATHLAYRKYHPSVKVLLPNHKRNN